MVAWLLSVGAKKCPGRCVKCQLWMKIFDRRNAALVASTPRTGSGADAGSGGAIYGIDSPGAGRGVHGMEGEPWAVSAYAVQLLALCSCLLDCDGSSCGLWLRLLCL